MAKIKKLNDKEFWAILENNSGLLSRTADAIEKKFGVSYTRQSVFARANKDEKSKERLANIRERDIDIAEEGLQSLMRSSDERVKMQSIKYFLSTIGKSRGYMEQQNIDHTSGGKPIMLGLEPSQFIKGKDDK